MITGDKIGKQRISPCPTTFFYGANTIVLPCVDGQYTTHCQYVYPCIRRSGDASAGALMRSDYAIAKVQYRYSNYIATVTAANLSYVGLSLREQYVSGNS
jgi:hypothetical protein